MAAPPGVVWSVLTDFPKYKEWNPVVTTADARLEVGHRMALRVAPSGRIAFIVRPKLSKIVPGEELRWRRKMPFLTTEQIFELEPVDGGTKVVHGQEATGAWVPAGGKRLQRMRAKALRDYLPFETALRDRAEASTRP